MKSNNDAVMAKIESNWNTFESYCKELGSKTEPIMAMLEKMGERAAVAPASSRIEFHNAFVGGFIDHSLRVAEYTIKFAVAASAKIDKESLLVSSLFHDWGKVGGINDGEDYYVEQKSDWHRERGMMYLPGPGNTMPNAQLGLWTMSQFGVKLTQEEYLGILLNDGQYVPENKPYGMKEPRLALLVHYADRWATQCEKSRESVLSPAKAIF